MYLVLYICVFFSRNKSSKESSSSTAHHKSEDNLYTSPDELIDCNDTDNINMTSVTPGPDHYRHSQTGDEYAILDKTNREYAILDKTHHRSTQASASESDYYNIGEPDIVRCSQPSRSSKQDLGSEVKNSDGHQTGPCANITHDSSQLAEVSMSTEEGIDEDYYTVDQPVDPRNVQEAERFQPGAKQSLQLSSIINPSEDGIEEDYYTVDQPSDPSRVQQAERFQPNSKGNICIFLHPTWSACRQLGHSLTPGQEDYDYSYGICSMCILSITHKMQPSLTKQRPQCHTVADTMSTCL